MKKKLSLFILSGCCAVQLLGQSGNCANSDFEYGNFTNWQGATSKVPGISWSSGIISNGTNAPASDGAARHTIVTSAGGFDPIAINPVSSQPEIPVLAPGGGSYSVRLGNSDIGQIEKLLKTFLVSNDNIGFTYQYAVILNESANHQPNERAYFQIRLLDANGIVIPGPCGSYSVYAGQDTSFVKIIIDPTQSIEYKKWTTVGIDLTPYIGQTITIEFTTSDCTKPGHFGYAYVDTKCSPLEIEVDYCPGDPDITLTAPEGYATYSWVDILGNPLGNTQKIIVQGPKLGDQFMVTMNSVTGCQTTVLTTIKFSPPPDIPDYTIKQNVITPNGDNINDVFLTDRFKYTQDFNLKVYNRFGIIVFETDDVKQGWDGRQKDMQYAEGVYFWVTSYTSRCFKEGDKAVISKGFVHVLK